MKRRHFNTASSAGGSTGKAAGSLPDPFRETRLAYSTSGETDTPAKVLPPRTAGPGVRIHLDRRASARVVTVVTGLPRGEDAERLVRELKAACGTGGTVKDGVLELQGDHRERVEAALTRRRIPWKRAGG